VLLCLGSPSSRSEGPKHPEVHRVRLDHGIDTAAWTQNDNWVQIDVNFLSRDDNNFWGVSNARRFCEFYEKLVEAYR
jgi:hypothetical protein